MGGWEAVLFRSIVLCHCPLQYILLLFAPILGVKEPIAKSSYIAKGICPYFLEKLSFNNLTSFAISKPA